MNGGVDVGMAQPADLDAHQDLTGAGLGYRQVLDLEGGGKVGDYGSFHG